MTIWKDVVQRNEGKVWIDESWFHTLDLAQSDGYWQLRCGAYVIGNMKSEDDIEKIKKWHIKLRDLYSEQEITKDITNRYTCLENTAENIQQKLFEFNDMEMFQETEI